MKIIYIFSTLSGTIIGVGIFSLPYITLKVGFWLIVLYFIILSLLTILIHLFFGELSLKTEDFKRLPGFTKVYLGEKAEKISYLSTILGLTGALLAYLIVGGEFLSELFSFFLNGNNYNLFFTIVYFVLGAIVIFYGAKAIAKIEFWSLILFFIIIFFLFLKVNNLIEIQNLFIGGQSLESKDLFLPYGAILFSLWGAALIPEIEEMLGNRKKLILKIIPISIIVPVLVYLFFIYLVLGVSGTNTTSSALIGLKSVIDNKTAFLLLVFGLLTTFTSFVALGLTLKKIFWYDLKINKNLSWTITCFIPFILFLLGFKNFINVISLVGGIMLAIDGILILLMYNKIRPERKFLTYFLIFFLLAGIIYSFIYFI